MNAKIVKKLLSLTVAVLLCIMAFSACGADGYFLAEGYSVINLEKNETIVGHDDGWLYIRHYNKQNFLYRLRYDGTDRQEIDFDGSFYSSVFSDGWMYFVRTIFDSNVSGGTIHSLMRMRPDGSAQIVLDVNVSLLFTLQDDWIYYTGSSSNRSLYRIRIDGTDKQQIANVSINNTSYTITSDYIFYIETSSLYGSGSIVRCNLDGTNVTTITDCDASNIKLTYNNYLYYEVSLTGTLNSFELHRIDFYGKNHVNLASPVLSTAYSASSKSNIVAALDIRNEGYFLGDVFEKNDYIYYSYNYYKYKEDDYVKVFRMKPDGSKHEEVVDKQALNSFEVSGTTFYIVTEYKKTGKVKYMVFLYKISNSGEHILVYHNGTKVQHGGIFVENDKLYIVTSAK